MKIRRFSNLIYVAELRYLQALHEQREWTAMEAKETNRMAPIGQSCTPFQQVYSITSAGYLNNQLNS